jgi:hypothetical protein
MKDRINFSWIFLFLLLFISSILAQQNESWKEEKSVVHEQLVVNLTVQDPTPELTQSIHPLQQNQSHSKNPSTFFNNRDEIQPSESPNAYNPLWKQLQTFSLSERDNAVIEFEVLDYFTANATEELKTIETLWNNGDMAGALDRLRKLEESGEQLDIAVGINWKVPKTIQNPAWGSDVQISNKSSVQNSCLDFHAGTKHLFAAIRYYSGSDWYWSVNISTDDGSTWKETFELHVTNKINDISATVVNDYFFVAYTGKSNQTDARIRRFKVSDGVSDGGYGYKTVFNKGVMIKEFAITSNADTRDDGIYYMAILANNSLEYYYAHQSNDWTNWEENKTGVTNAHRGLDVCFNEGYNIYFLFISYIDTDNKLHVDRRRSSVWEIIKLDNISSSNRFSSVSAYHDYVISAYEYSYTNGTGIKYLITYDGGDSWKYGDIAEPSPGQSFFGPDVAARRGGGITLVYIEEAGTFDYCWYTHRDYDVVNWSTSEKFNEINPNTEYQMCTEWVPPISGYDMAYGAIWTARYAYFDRLDFKEEGSPTWIKVTAPNGGEILHVGKNYVVTWTTDKYVGLVEILLSKDGGINWIMLTDPYFAENNGSYDYLPTADHVSDQCLIHITSIENPKAKDESDQTFRIVDTTSKKHYIAAQIPGGVSAPTIDGTLNDDAWKYTDGLEILARGGVPNDFSTPWTNFGDNKVTWKAVWSASTNLLYVAIEVQDDIAGANDNDYNNLWQDDTIELFTDGNKNGGDYSGSCGEAQQWLIRRDNAKHLGFTSGPYTGPAIKSAIQYGANGNWVLELAMTIYNYYPSSIKRLALHDVIGWEVWYDDSDNQHKEGGKWARDHQVGWGYSGPAYYNADYFHELEFGPAVQIPFITVKAPNGGEIWYVGTTRLITWDSFGTSGDVKIECSTNGGSNWTPITHSTPDVGSYSWTIPNTPSTNCLVRITDTDGSPTDKSDAPFEIRSDAHHFIPIWTGNPFQPMTIHCTKAEITGQPLIFGDEIGVFDGNKCVGAVVLTRTPSKTQPVEIICSKDDGTGNGFNEGNSIVFKLWDRGAAKEHGALAQFLDPQTGSPINPVPFTGLGTAVVELKTGPVTQSIPLNSGWNIFSLAVTPQGSHDMLDVLAPILESYVIKVIDERGRVVQKLFGRWYNSIGNWEKTEGYYINVKQTVTYKVTGTEIATPLTIPLYAGWNIISYPCLSLSQNAMSVVQSLINSGYLVKVIDERGRSIVKIFGSWNNSIGDMHPGEGYYVNVNTNCTLTISCLGSVLFASLTNQPESVTPKHFQVQLRGHPFEPMNIFVVEARVDGEYLNVGDEIAVFNGDQCVGASVVQHPLSVNTPLEIIASKDDGSGNGFKPGDKIRFKVWRSNTGEEGIFDAEGVQYLDPDKAELISASMFEGFGTAVVAINLVTTSVVEHVAMPQSYHLYQNHPNPFNPATTISYDLPEVTDVRIEIYDLQGNVVRRLFEGQQDAGHHAIEWDGRNRQGSRVGSGIYFYKLICSKFVATKKMILTK